jgi:hypothetical protein
MLLLEITQTPNVSSLHKSEQMQRAHRFSVPVEIREHQEPIIGALTRVPENHVLLLRPALKDIEDPVQSTFLPLSAHIRPHIVTVDLRRLGHHA